MGKIADALEKAGYDEENDWNDSSRKTDDDDVTSAAVQSEVEVESDFVAPTRQERGPQAEISPEPVVVEEPEQVEEQVQDEEQKQAVEVKPAYSKEPDSVTKPAVKTRRKKHKRSPASSGSWDERLFKAVNRDPFLPEVFKTLRSKIRHPIDGRPLAKTIMVTSAIPKEGKSFVTANLGISLAQGMDQFSLLVDCDLRRPSLGGLFGIDSKRGLVDYLRDHQELSGLILKTSINKLSILPSGKAPVNPAELLDSSRMCDLVTELSERYEDRLIIFDSPPVQVASEAAVLANQVDAVIVVVRQNGAGKPQVEKLIDSIGADKILGIVFNSHTTNFVEKSLMQGYGYYPQTYN